MLLDHSPHAYHTDATVGDRRQLRWCRWLGALAGVLVVGDWAAVVARVDEHPLDVVFTVVVISVFPVGCLAIARAAPHLRRFVVLAVSALFFQMLHNGLRYLTGGHLSDFGTWTVFLWIAMVLGVAAAWVGVRDIVRPRDTLLDYSVVVAAAASVAVAMVGHAHGGWSFQTITEVVRCLLSLLTVVIIASATLGRWQALPIPVGLVGVSLVFDAAGFLWMSYFISKGTYTTDRWPTALWFSAAVLALLAGLCVIAGIDRPIRLARHALPGMSPVSLLAPALVALGLATGVAVHGAVSASSSSLFAGIGAIVWIAVAALLRTTAALSEARTAYRGLDAAHLELERAHERSAELVAKLERRNLELTTIQTLLGEVFEIADERSDGQLRSNLEETGADLARWLPPSRHRRDD